MIITVLISVTCYMIVVAICNFLILLPIPQSLCLQKAPQLVMVLYLVTQTFVPEGSGPLVILSELGFCDCP